MGKTAEHHSRRTQPQSRLPSLPSEDNTPAGLSTLLAANKQLRAMPWPAPYDQTTHRLHLGDARDLSWIPDSSALRVDRYSWCVNQRRSSCSLSH
jgi:hypothetical protein